MRRVRARALLGPAALLVALGAALLVGSGVFAAASPRGASRAVAIERDVKCPESGCGDLSVLQSEAPASVALRDQIAREVALGRSTTSILAALEDRWGTGILLTPPAGGFDDVLWIAPLCLAGLAVAGASAAAVRRRVTGRRPAQRATT